MLPNSSLDSIKLCAFLSSFFSNLPPSLPLSPPSECLIIFLSILYVCVCACVYLAPFVCACKCRCVCTNVSALCLLSSSLLQAAAEPGQRWRCGSGPALLRLHPGVHLSARLFPLRGFRAPGLPLWRQLDWQGAGLQRYVVGRGLTGHMIEKMAGGRGGAEKVKVFERTIVHLHKGGA